MAVEIVRAKTTRPSTRPGSTTPNSFIERAVLCSRTVLNDSALVNFSSVYDSNTKALGVIRRARRAMTLAGFAGVKFTQANDKISENKEVELTFKLGEKEYTIKIAFDENISMVYNKVCLCLGETKFDLSPETKFLTLVPQHEFLERKVIVSPLKVEDLCFMPAGSKTINADTLYFRAITENGTEIRFTSAPTVGDFLLALDMKLGIKTDKLLLEAKDYDELRAALDCIRPIAHTRASDYFVKQRDRALSERRFPFDLAVRDLILESEEVAGNIRTAYGLLTGDIEYDGLPIRSIMTPEIYLLQYSAVRSGLLRSIGSL